MSDHFSGPRAIAGPTGDICDLYAFPSPERPGHLTLVLTVMPRATSVSRFSDAIVCRFRLRPLTVRASGPATSFDFGTEADEIVVVCAFDEPGDYNVQRGRCTGPNGLDLEVTVCKTAGTHMDGLHVYAGPRSDPFFIDLPGYLASLKTGRLAFKEVGQNSLTNFNVLSLVVEIDCAAFLPANGNTLFAVVGETVVRGKLPIRLERVGRPEVKNVLLEPKQFDRVNRDLEVRDLYNLEDAYHLSGEYRGAYRARLNANLAALDGLDGQTDWPLGQDGMHPLTDLLLADFLVVDVAKPFSEQGYFEIEQATLAGRPHTTCGGRSLNQHVMDTIYTLLVNGGNGPKIGDGVAGATVPASTSFPYLAPPNSVPPAALQGGIREPGHQH